MTPIEQLRRRAEDLHLYGVLAHWHELADSLWLEPLLTWEETERARRSLERRLGSAHIGRFKPSPTLTGTGRSNATGQLSANYSAWIS